MQAAQTELNKAADDFRALHAERQELLAQWEGVLEAVSQRDKAILAAGQELAAQRAAVAAAQAELDAQAAELQREEAAGGWVDGWDRWELGAGFSGATCARSQVGVLVWSCTAPTSKLWGFEQLLWG